MSVYLKDIPLPEAQERFRSALGAAGLWQVLGTQIIRLDENALGRITSEPIWARVSSPNYHASAMDGFAVRSEDTIGAGPGSPVLLSLGSDNSQPPAAVYVDTGDPVPEWANAVIPIENTEAIDMHGGHDPSLRNPTAIRIRASVPPWSHIRPLGEDIVATQLVLPAGHVLKPADLGAIAASGHTEISVTRKPRVAILPTGSELVPIGTSLKRGDILEYNSLVLAAQVKAMGADPVRYPITVDDLDAICARVSEASHESDLILLNAGSSAGAEDFSAQVVQKLGYLLVHGVAVRPGHPVIIGMLDGSDGKIPIIGVPGYPVSAALTIDIFVEPVLARWLGRSPLEYPEVDASLTRKITSPPGDDDYIRVALGRVGENLLAAPLARGAGVITSLVRADGLLVLPSGTQGAEAGQKVRVKLTRTQSDLEKTIFCIGSHDVILDLLAQYLAVEDRRFVSANVGSQAGLIALERGEAHLAGSHLLDPETGEYNLAAIERYLPGVPLRLVTLVQREQGLMVKRGNPLRIVNLASLTRPDVRFVNRQRGAGTRVLLDYQLYLLGIVTPDIRGYNQEEFTHLGVAAAVSSGRADCGLGIPAAAQALDLDFVPLYHERYDLVVPRYNAESPLLSPLWDVLEGTKFRNAVSALPGYDTRDMGKIILEK